MGRLLIRIRQLIDALIYGIPTTIKLLIANRNTVYYIPHVGIGDYCEALGYLQAYKAYHKISHITIVATKDRLELLSFYTGYDDVMVLSTHSFTGLVYLGSLPIGRLIHLRCRRIENVSYTLHMNKSLLYMNPALHISECTKVILKIPKDSELVPPSVPEVDVAPLIEEYHLPKLKTILPNPYTSGVAVRELESAFYPALAQALIRCGYRVVTILGNDQQKPILGTEGLTTSLAEAWYLAKWCGWVIGTRSGFFDLIQYSGCNVVALYSKNYQQKDFFALKPHHGTGCIMEYTYEDDASVLTEKIVNSVMQHI